MSQAAFIIKRDGSFVPFDREKIVIAIHKAAAETGEFDLQIARRLANQVISRIDLLIDTGALTQDELSVEGVQDIVEEVLITSQYSKTAKAYIIYREQRSQTRRRSLFKKRLSLKPYEYPELAEYVDAIRHSYWIHTEFNYTSDIHDYMVNVSSAERSAIKNAMLAIAQVEIAVKTFWGDLYKRLPKPEIGSVGYTFAESEVRHHDAYSHLLEILGLNEEFKQIKDIPALIQRVNYLENHIATAHTTSDRDFTQSILLFSLFIEHISLFSQFLIIMSFNKYRNLFKGVSNVIEATSKEEQIHGLFGIDLINIIRQEHPEWFDKEMKQTVITACEAAFDAESDIIDWIYEAGELDFLPSATVKEFVKNRLNNSLVSIGYERLFEVDEGAVSATDWFDDEIVATKHLDFFVKRSINYTKRARPVTSDDLF